MVEINEKCQLCVYVISCIITISTCIYASYTVNINLNTNIPISGIVIVGVLYGSLVGNTVAALILSMIDLFIIVYKNVSEYRKNKSTKNLLH